MTEPYESARARMVEEQLVARGISDPAVLRAFSLVPRHLFVPLSCRWQAYHDAPLPIDRNQTISQPYMVALMLQRAQLRPDMRVLEVGTGSGYQAALLAQISKEIYTIERHASLARDAARTLRAAGFADRVSLRVGDGTLGWPEKGPFEAIIVSAAGPRIPGILCQQLQVQGRLLIPIQKGNIQILNVVTRVQDDFQREEKEPCAFVPLIGEHGWADPT